MKKIIYTSKSPTTVKASIDLAELDTVLDFDNLIEMFGDDIYEGNITEDDENDVIRRVTEYLEENYGDEVNTDPKIKNKIKSAVEDFMDQVDWSDTRFGDNEDY